MEERWVNPIKPVIDKPMIRKLPKMGWEVGKDQENLQSKGTKLHLTRIEEVNPKENRTMSQLVDTQTILHHFVKSLCLEMICYPSLLYKTDN